MWKRSNFIFLVLSFPSPDSEEHTAAAADGAPGKLRDLSIVTIVHITHVCVLFHADVSNWKLHSESKDGPFYVCGGGGMLCILCLCIIYCRYLLKFTKNIFTLHMYVDSIGFLLVTIVHNFVCRIS